MKAAYDWVVRSWLWKVVSEIEDQRETRRAKVSDGKDRRFVFEHVSVYDWE